MIHIKYETEEKLLLAMKVDEVAIMYAAEELKSRKDLALKSVSYHPYSIFYLNEELKNDKDVIKEALSKNGALMGRLPTKYRLDKELALKAVNSSGESLKYLSEELRDDEEIAIAAIKQIGTAFKYISKRLKGKKDLVMFAIDYDPNTYVFLDHELQNDRDITLKTAQLVSVFHEMPPQFYEDKEIMLLHVKKQPNLYLALNENLKLDFDFVELVIKGNIDKLFILQSVADNNVIIEYIVDHHKDDVEKYMLENDTINKLNTAGKVASNDIYYKIFNYIEAKKRETELNGKLTGKSNIENKRRKI